MSIESSIIPAELMRRQERAQEEIIWLVERQHQLKINHQQSKVDSDDIREALEILWGEERRIIHFRIDTLRLLLSQLESDTQKAVEEALSRRILRGKERSDDYQPTRRCWYGDFTPEKRYHSEDTNAVELDPGIEWLRMEPFTPQVPDSRTDRGADDVEEGLRTNDADWYDTDSSKDEIDEECIKVVELDKTIKNLGTNTVEDMCSNNVEWADADWTDTDSNTDNNEEVHIKYVDVDPRVKDVENSGTKSVEDVNGNEADWTDTDSDSDSHSRNNLEVQLGLDGVEEVTSSNDVDTDAKTKDVEDAYSHEAAFPCVGEISDSGTNKCEEKVDPKKDRMLKKKLRQALDLQRKQMAGKVLNAEELAKIASLAALEAQLTDAVEHLPIGSLLTTRNSTQYRPQLPSADQLLKSSHPSPSAPVNQTVLEEESPERNLQLISDSRSTSENQTQSRTRSPVSVPITGELLPQAPSPVRVQQSKNSSSPLRGNPTHALPQPPVTVPSPSKLGRQEGARVEVNQSTHDPVSAPGYPSHPQPQPLGKAQPLNRGRFGSIAPTSNFSADNQRNKIYPVPMDNGNNSAKTIDDPYSHTSGNDKDGGAGNREAGRENALSAILPLQTVQNLPEIDIVDDDIYDVSNYERQRRKQKATRRRLACRAEDAAKENDAGDEVEVDKAEDDDRGQTGADTAMESSKRKRGKKRAKTKANEKKKNTAHVNDSESEVVDGIFLENEEVSRLLVQLQSLRRIGQHDNLEELWHSSISAHILIWKSLTNFQSDRQRSYFLQRARELDIEVDSNPNRHWDLAFNLCCDLGLYSDSAYQRIAQSIDPYDIDKASSGLRHYPGTHRAWSTASKHTVSPAVFFHLTGQIRIRRTQFPRRSEKLDDSGGQQVVPPPVSANHSEELDNSESPINPPSNNSEDLASSGTGQQAAKKISDLAQPIAKLPDYSEIRPFPDDCSNRIDDFDNLEADRGVGRLIPGLEGPEKSSFKRKTIELGISVLEIQELKRKGQSYKERLRKILSGEVELEKEILDDNMTTHTQVSLPLPILPESWSGEKDFKAIGHLSAATQRSIEPVGPHFLAHARRARHKRTFSEDDRIQAQENVKKVEDDDADEISEPEDPMMLSRDAKDWKGQDHYAVLGLSKYRYKATEEQIKRAHRKKVLRHHPDKKAAAGSTEDDSFFKCIQKATEILLDPVKRRQYDSIDEHADVEPPTKKQAQGGKYYKLWGATFKAEARFSRIQPVPKFGDEKSTKEDVSNFYQFFYNFDSWRSFEYLDEDVPDDNENRDQKRHMERKNNNARKKKKTEDSARLRKMLDDASATDERLKRFRQEENAAKNKKKLDREAAEKKAMEDAKAKKEAEALAAKAAEEKAKAEREQSKKAKEAAKNAVKKNKRVLKASVKDANYFSTGEPSAAVIDCVLNDVELVISKQDPDGIAALAGKLNGLSVADQIKEVWSSEVSELVGAGKLREGDAKTLV